MADDVRPTDDDLLAREARNGPRAALAAGVAGMCGLVGSIITALLNGRGPSSEARVLTLGDPLSRAAARAPRPPPGRHTERSGRRPPAAARACRDAPHLPGQPRVRVHDRRAAHRDR